MCSSLLVLLLMPAADGPLDAAALARRIDHHLEARLKEKGVPPAAPADDAEFIRRVYLDLAGCIPSIIDVRDFLDDTRPDKRRLWVDMLLAGQKPGRKPDAFARHFAGVWRDGILARANTEQRAALAPALEEWLRERFRANTPYDRLVRELLADPGSVFYQINENKPENVAASASRLFLGIKLECAQCHDDRSGGGWSQEQFWSLAAFFAGNKKEIAVPGKKKSVRAAFLDGDESLGGFADAPHALFAGWLTSARNPWFARAAVDRVWGYFFGTGLTDPIDEHGAHNPPSHPALLDELARQFTAHNFDLKYLIRAVVASRAYQRSSVADHRGQDDPRLFARMAVRGLSAEQLFDSLAEATEYPDEGAGGIRSGNEENLTPRQKFLARFAHQDRPTEAPTSVLQALYLMNSPFIAERTSPDQNRTLATLAEQRGPDARRLETLFLVVLSRKPTAAESKRFLAYLKRGDRRRALSDIFWALLNSAEFRLNH